MEIKIQRDLVVQFTECNLKMA